MKPGKPSNATRAALEGIAKAMAQLELKKIEGYKQSKMMQKDEEDEDDDDLVKVLEARAEER
jgi:hypothetical protein